MPIQLIRHATMLLSVSGKKILVDPYLAAEGVQPPVPLSASKLKNPLVPLPMNIDEIISSIDAILLTHYHFDHFDQTAKFLLPKDILIFCQPADVKKLERDGFTNIQPVPTEVEWEDILILRFDANHGFGVLGFLMGKSSSFLIRTKQISVFFTGDAVYDETLKNNLIANIPSIVIANAGAASFFIGKPITMDAEAVSKIVHLLPQSKIIAVHMDTVNHCKHTRSYLKDYLHRSNLTEKVFVLQDGEKLMIE